MAENRWDASGYARHARFVSDLGMPVVDWLAPVAGERILDLGCGDGALTAKLAAMGVDVMGIDSSPSMVQAAVGRGLDVVQGDMHELALGTEFDAIFTNAVLHWTRDIEAVVRGVSAHLKSGGRFVGEFGGFGNVAAIVVAVRAAIQMEDETGSGFCWYFPTPTEFAAVLEANGFEVVRVELIPRPTPLPTGMRNWLETFARPFVEGIEEQKQQAILMRASQLLAGVLRDQAGNWTADYVRLRFHALLRPGAQD